MTTKSDFKSMSDGCELWVTKWIPDDAENIKGVVQLHHGLAEHSLRYDRLGSVLCESGFALVAYDMRGHGRTAENAEKKRQG
jgi:alpha-beta hydrolase superfamily lysophospholipase